MEGGLRRHQREVRIRRYREGPQPLHLPAGQPLHGASGGVHEHHVLLSRGHHARQHVRGCGVRRGHVGVCQLHLTHPAQGELLEARAGTDEALHEVVRGIGQDALRGVVLHEPRPLVEHGNPVPELHGLVEVVGHAHDGLLQLGLDVEQLVLQPLTGDGVHGSEGLVHEQHGRVRRERPGHSHALLLAAGELLGVAVPVGVRVQGDEFEQLVHAARDALSVPLQHLGDQGDVRPHRHVREQPTGLDDVADVAAQLVTVHARDVVPVDHDAAARGLDEPVDHLQRGGLAAPGGAHEHDHAAGRDLQGEATHRGLLLARVPLGDLPQEDGGTAHGLLAGCCC